MLSCKFLSRLGKWPLLSPKSKGKRVNIGIEAKQAQISPHFIWHDKGFFKPEVCLAVTIWVREVFVNSGLTLPKLVTLLLSRIPKISRTRGSTLPELKLAQADHIPAMPVFASLFFIKTM